MEYLRQSSLFGIVLLLASCASEPMAFLFPTNTVVEGANVVSMLAITTRAESNVPGEMFNGERSDQITTQIMDVSVPPNHEVGNLNWPDPAEFDPTTQFSLVRASQPTPAQAWQWFEGQKTDGHVLIFVHGYNVRFADAVYRLAQIAHDLDAASAPVLFSWPSNGKILGYYYDRESAAVSRDAFETVISAAVKSDAVTNITILAHSMGSWITMETLRQMAIRNGTLSSKISDVILAAPDLDIDVFKHQFRVLGKSRPHFTFLVSGDDRALGFTRFLAGGVQRLGALDPTEEPHKTYLNNTPGITIVDLSDVQTQDNLNHIKFAQDANALEVARKTIEGEGKDPSARTSISQQAGALMVTLGKGVASMSE